MSPRLRRIIPYLLAGVALTAWLGWQLAANPAHNERDVTQERLDTASPPLGPGLTVGQTFVSQHAGLSSVEILLVVYNPSQAVPSSARLVMTLERLDEPGHPPVRAELDAAGMQHNQRVVFPFAPLADSRQAIYRLTLSSNGAYGLGAWYSATEAYAYGERLENGAPQPGDLYFDTGYDYRLTDALRDAGLAAARSARIVPALFLLLALPGLVLSLYLLPGGRVDGILYATLALSLSLAFWPLLWLWASVAGVSLANGRVWGIVGLLLAAGMVRLWRRRGALARPVIERGEALPAVVLGVVLLLVMATRVLQMRALAVPPWIDSVHHTVLAQLLSERGLIPSTFEPYLPHSIFHYHFGFHVNAATFLWLSGLPSYRAVLILGQVLNAAAALVVAAWAFWLTRSHWAGVAAAIVAGLLSTMPAYYLSWGRYTQLTGLVLLPAVCMASLWIFERGRASWRAFALGGFLLAGLFLAHYRVLVFYMLFLVASVPAVLLRGRLSWAKVKSLAGRGLPLAGIALFWGLPWAARLVARLLPAVGSVYGGWGGPEGYNDFPTALITAGGTRPLFYVAGLGMVWGLVRRKLEVALLAVWVGLWLLAANLHLIGLADIWLIHNSSVVISLWLPVSVLCGWLVGDLVSALGEGKERPPRWLAWQQGLAPALCVGALVLAGWGAWQKVDIANPSTVLATQEDVYAMRWIAESTPPDALFLINTRVWQGELHVGSDGGWWLPILGRRAATLPCVLYHQSEPAYRDAVVGLAKAVEDTPSLDDPAFVARLKREGICYVFVGARGGRLMPKELDASPHFALRYALGPTRVYEFVPNP